MNIAQPRRAHQERRSFIYKNDEYGPVEMRCNPRTGVVEFFMRGRPFYDLNAKFSSATEALEWIRQLSQKRWVSTELISRICSFALGAIGHVQ